MHATYGSGADAEAPPIGAPGERAPPTLKAVRRHCLDCCNGSAKEVELCPAKRCPLWTMRFGRRPDPAEYIDDPTKLYPLEVPITLGEFAAKGMSTLAAIRRRDASTARVAHRTKLLHATSTVAISTPFGSAGTQTGPGSEDRPRRWRGYALLLGKPLLNCRLSLATRPIRPEHPGTSTSPKSSTEPGTDRDEVVSCHAH
jgi:hypothetical protein